ncbi:MAG TPA: hypothetical protein VFG50_15735 [Rhodothermales bacterium]|nr:hypothetical protein [Rhodothermales bacterium]
MQRILSLSLLLLIAVPTSLLAQMATPDRQALITSALSAAPPEVAAGATVIDMDKNVLRQGTNGWVCMPDMPDVPNNTPMCLDQTWLEVIDAWMNKREPNFSGIGISYMLQGDLPVSNVDPFATAPTADNEWVQSGPPHIMVVVSDHKLLEGLPTDPNNGGPWVMWKGTPYAHIMIPTIPRTK